MVKIKHPKGLTAEDVSNDTLNQLCWGTSLHRHQMQLNKSKYKASSRRFSNIGSSYLLLALGSA